MKGSPLKKLNGSCVPVALQSNARAATLTACPPFFCCKAIWHSARTKPAAPKEKPVSEANSKIVRSLRRVAGISSRSAGAFWYLGPLHAPQEETLSKLGAARPLAPWPIYWRHKAWCVRDGRSWRTRCCIHRPNCKLANIALVWNRHLLKSSLKFNGAKYSTRISPFLKAATSSTSLRYWPNRTPLSRTISSKPPPIQKAFVTSTKPLPIWKAIFSRPPTASRTAQRRANCVT